MVYDSFLHELVLVLTRGPRLKEVALVNQLSHALSGQHWLRLTVTSDTTGSDRLVQISIDVASHALHFGFRRQIVHYLFGVDALCILDAH